MTPRNQPSFNKVRAAKVRADEVRAKTFMTISLLEYECRAVAKLLIDAADSLRDAKIHPQKASSLTQA